MMGPLKAVDRQRLSQVARIRARDHTVREHLLAYGSVALPRQHRDARDAASVGVLLDDALHGPVTLLHAP